MLARRRGPGIALSWQFTWCNSDRDATMASMREIRVEAAPDDATPEWQRNSVERSLLGARARAEARSHRFVAAALALIEERGTIDFPVQDVVDRAGMSIRTFYKYFASKEDLLVAVHQTILATELVPRLRKRCAAERDPVRRIRAYIHGTFDLSATGGAVSRVLTTNHNRLAESRPADLESALRPQLELVTELVASAAAADRLATDLDIETAARLLHQTVLAVVHANILGAGDYSQIGRDELWTFCAAALGLKRESPK